jgi:L-type amino acid transporter 9
LKGFTRNFENSFDGTNTNILQISNGFYGGLWAYGGWNNLNCLTEEIIKPKRFLNQSQNLNLQF